MKLFFPVFVLFVLLSFSLSAQSLRSLEKMNTNSIVVQQADQLTKAHILLDDPEKRTRNNRRYFYYSRGKIEHLQGGYHGHLLHGEFCNFSGDNRLQTQGWFKNGLKHGRWKEWDNSGDLIKEISWKKGKVQGRFTHFQKRNNQVIKGRNKNGKLHGRIKTYQDGVLQTISRYKNGALQSTKEAKTLKERLKGGKEKKEEKKKNTDK